MILTPFSGTALGLSPDMCHLVDGSTGMVTSHKAQEWFVLPAYPFNWRASASLITAMTDNTVPAEIGDSRIIRVSFPAGSCAPGDEYKGDTPETAALAGQLRPAGGMHYLQPIRRCRHAVLRYAIKFPLGFVWRGGGKLPGFSSMKWDASGGNTAVGGITSFTARQMFRPGGQITPYYYMGDNQASRWVDSHYHNPDMPGVNWGSAAFSGSTLFSTPWFATPGAYTLVEQELRLNDVGVQNGWGILRLNGVTVADRRDLVWRWNNDLWIDAIFNSGFFGGNTKSEGDGSIWPTLTGQTLDISRFLVRFVEF